MKKLKLKKVKDDESICKIKYHTPEAEANKGFYSEKIQKL